MECCLESSRQTLTVKLRWTSCWAAVSTMKKITPGQGDPYAILDRVVREGFSEEVMFELQFELGLNPCVLTSFIYPVFIVYLMYWRDSVWLLRGTLDNHKWIFSLEIWSNKRDKTFTWRKKGTVYLKIENNMCCVDRTPGRFGRMRNQTMRNQDALKIVNFK